MIKKIFMSFFLFIFISINGNAKEFGNLFAPQTKEQSTAASVAILSALGDLFYQISTIETAGTIDSKVVSDYDRQIGEKLRAGAEHLREISKLATSSADLKAYFAEKIDLNRVSQPPYKPDAELKELFGSGKIVSKGDLLSLFIYRTERLDKFIHAALSQNNYSSIVIGEVQNYLNFGNIITELMK